MKIILLKTLTRKKENKKIKMATVTETLSPELTPTAVCPRQGSGKVFSELGDLKRELSVTC